MNIITMLVIAFGLAMDAFAVSVASGIALKEAKVFNAMKMALFFGIFQMIMPLAGWSSGITVRRFIAGFDHFIAFGLLAFVGGRMIYESIWGIEKKERMNPFDTHVLFVLAVATSIDAFAVGLSFAFLKLSIVTPVLIIGLVTFSLSFAGVFTGNRFGHIFERKIEVAGGLILIAIGLKILIEHMRW